MLDWRGTALLDESLCKVHWRPFGTLPEATAAQYESTSRYDQYDGKNLLHDPQWSAASPYSRLAGADANLHHLMVGECSKSVRSSSGGVWYTQRVGPFVSTGGNDWWQLSWLVQPPNGTRGIAAHYVGAVDADGVRAFANPPIHLHHLHLVPGENDVFSRVRGSGKYASRDATAPFAGCRGGGSAMTQRDGSSETAHVQLARPCCHDGPCRIIRPIDSRLLAAF